MDRAILLWIHQHATPTLDALSRFSHQLGTMPFCVALALAAVVWHSVRGERREQAARVAAGLTTLCWYRWIGLRPTRHDPARERLGDTGPA